MTERGLESPPIDPRGPGGDSGDGDHIEDDVFIEIVADLVPQPDLDRLMNHIRGCPSCEKGLVAAGGDWEMFRARPAPPGWSLPARSSPSAVTDRLAGTTGKLREFNRRSGPDVSLFRRLVVPLSLAAVLLVIVLVPKARTPTAELSYWIPATSEVLKLRSSHPTDADSAFWMGLSAYEKRDLRTATALLMESKTGGGMDDLRRLHLASALVNSGRADECLEILKQLDLESLPQPWRADAYWMEYLAFVRLGRSDEAEERLVKMATWPGRIGELARERRAN